MIRPTRNVRTLATLSFVFLVAACSDSGTPTVAGPDLGLSISPTVVVDYLAGNGSQFVFLEPLVQGVPSGPLAPGLATVIEICNVDESPAGCVVLEASENGSHYQANWKDKTAQPNETYTITVSQLGVELGRLSLTLDGIAGDKAGRTFPIKFWVGEGLAGAVEELRPCLDDNRCNAAFVTDNDEPYVVTTVDEETGATMGVLTFPASAVPEGGLIVTLDCREDAGYEPGDGPLPTALRQWPLFCHVDARNPDGSPFVGELPGTAMIDLCVVDQDLPGQDDYHPWDGGHGHLVLGKSDGPGDFTFLAPAPSALVDCAGNTTSGSVAQAGSAARWLDQIGSGLGTVFGLFLPQELHAAAMWFRDGGVGGLITSFSDINPVEPATIHGLVLDALGAGVPGVTVTLSGDASAATVTDADGEYTFSPLQAAVGGSHYTVTISELPDGVDFDEVSQDVEVTGSDDYHVAFAASLPDGIHYFEDTGNYYQAVAAEITWDDARTAAAALPPFQGCSATLATVLSGEENDFIHDHLPGATAAGYLLGGHLDDGEWSWITGEPWSYTNWHDGEPSGDGTVLQYFGRWGAPVDQWNDTVHDFLQFGYVVEYQCPVIG
jgi:hypothetical protein